jgi:phosphoesterase RecJ-like protein
MLALASVLKRMNKRVYLYSSDPVPGNLSFLPQIRTIKVDKLPKSVFDVLILLECSNPKRAGNLKNLQKKVQCIVNIDHHKTSQVYGDINLIDHSSSSTAEIVYQVFYQMKIILTQKEAACLYTGIVTDTGRFHFPATSSRTFEITSRLLETGFNFSKINDVLYSTQPLPALKLLGRALADMELVFDGKAALMVLKKADFAMAGACIEHSENIINYGIMIPLIKVSVLFREEGWTIQPCRALSDTQQEQKNSNNTVLSVTFRSKGSIDVSSIAQKFGGGGHKNAAGCRLKMSVEEAKKKILPEIKKII